MSLVALPILLPNISGASNRLKLGMVQNCYGLHFISTGNGLLSPRRSPWEDSRPVAVPRQMVPWGALWGVGSPGCRPGTRLGGGGTDRAGEPRPPSRPCSLKFRSRLPPCIDSRDPGRADRVWLCFLGPRGASQSWCCPVAGISFLTDARRPCSRGGSQHAPCTRAAVLPCGAPSTSASSPRDGPSEKEPASEFWALRLARGAGWSARRCWPSLCGFAWRPGLPLWVRSWLPARKAERSGAGGEDLEAGSNSES